MNDIGLMLADKEDYIVDDFGLVPPITIKDFIHMGEDYEKFYENIILPWRLCWRSFYTESQYNEINSHYSGLADYDIFFINFDNGNRMSFNTEYGKKELVQTLKESINFIFKCDCNVDYVNGLFIIDEFTIINKANFNSICEIILKTNSCEKSIMQELPKFENDRQMDIYFKLQEGRRRSSEKNKLGIKTLLNIVMVYTKYQINDIIKNMTVYQLFNTYSSLSLEDGYKMNLTWLPIVSDFKKLDLEHWSTKLK